MDNLSLFRCKNCGGELDTRQAVDGVIECKYCQTPWTVPKNESTPETLKYLHDGNSNLDVCRFEDAFTFFQKVSELDPNEPEAYFGMALAAFRVQFLKDEVNDCLQPICHEISDKNFVGDKNYRKAVELATDSQKQVYRHRGRDIDEIREEFNVLKESGLNYDCFICVKVTEEDGKTRTEDYHRANEIYYHLKDKGYNPFFSEREMKGRTGSAYEALILYALYTSECMLIVCSNEEYLQTKWVKNEYTRFMRMLNSEQKERDSITFAFEGTPIEKLPNGKKIQGIDLAKKDAYSRLIDFVEAHTPEARLRREEEAKRRDGQEELILRQIEEQKHLAEEQKKAQRDLENRLINLQTQNVSASVGATATVQSLLQRAKQEVETGDKSKARDYYIRVLDVEPNCAEAWWGLFLLDMEVINEGEIVKSITHETLPKIKSNRNYSNAVKYAMGEFANRVEVFQKTIFSGDIWWSLFLREMKADKWETVVSKCNYDILLKIKYNHSLVLAKKYASGELSHQIDEFSERIDSKVSECLLPDEEIEHNALLQEGDKIIAESDAYAEKHKKEMAERQAGYNKLRIREESLSEKYEKLLQKTKTTIVPFWFFYTLAVPIVFVVILAVYLIPIAPIRAMIRSKNRKELAQCGYQLSQVRDQRSSYSKETNKLVQEWSEYSNKAASQREKLEERLKIVDKRIEYLKSCL